MALIFSRKEIRLTLDNILFNKYLYRQFLKNLWEIDAPFFRNQFIQEVWLVLL